jgi:hypothetical protein
MGADMGGGEMTRPDTTKVLDGLKDFQLRTVNYVFDRLYGAQGTERFLVADEVGLGKTLVARGVIARTIEYLWDKQDHIEIVYICSNADIARQNVRRLAIPGCGVEEMRATRLTLLPLELRQRGEHRVNFIALTPGTSFELSQGGGWAKERAVLYLLLRKAWGIGDEAAPKNVLGEYGRQSFDREIWSLTQASLDETIVQEFVQRMSVAHELRSEFQGLCQIFPRSDSFPDREGRIKRHRWLGKMRTELTKVCIESLKPSLVIMDEFQRFRNLLNDETDAGKLAAELFGYARDEGSRGPRTLLLSATPYKMLSMHHEQSDDHYRDLLETLTFLGGRDSLTKWKVLFDEYQRATLRLTDKNDDHWTRLAESRDKLARELRQVMVRTERLASSPRRGEMLWEKDMPNNDLCVADVRAWLALQEIADKLSQGDCIEYWKSAPYVLNFMDRYQLSKAFHETCPNADKGWEMHRLVAKHAETFLPVDQIQEYKRVPATNARLRSIERETLDTDAWKMLWVPPSLPHYSLGGVFAGENVRTFTKSLIFSAWHVVPKAVSALLSYEAERRMMRSAKPRGKLTNSAVARKKRGLRLVFAQSDGRRSGFPLFTLVYPSLTLAEVGDPLTIARGLPKESPTMEEVIEVAESRIRILLTPLQTGAPTNGPEDEAWYWLAPMLLDLIHRREASLAWWSQPDLSKNWMLQQEGDEALQHGAWGKHVLEASDRVRAPNLGRPPADLPRLLAHVAVGAPATCALRSLTRGGADSSIATRLSSARIGHAFLTLFNGPEPRALLLGINDEGPYWRRVLEYACEGGLQAVLDEFVHLLGEDRSVEPEKLSAEVCAAMRLRTSILRADDISAPPGKRRVMINQPADSQPPSEATKDDVHQGFAMRVRFAMRFGDDKTETDATGNRREAVRHAFNSPFWPFVLVTTSVGQEGLDFHRYCHRVIHWNLPSNPVDLEQREGRIHRYKGHAVRKNLTQKHRSEALRAYQSDAWTALFEAGAATRETGENELIPYWVYPGEAKIERCVPLLPMSREVPRLQMLRRALTVYRMAFGHARQEDVIEHLLARVPSDLHDSLCASLQLDLGPP